MTEKTAVRLTTSCVGAVTLTRKCCAVAVTWFTYYLIATLLLLLLVPTSDDSYPWTGNVLAFWILMFGAYRLSKVGAACSVAFIYGCGTAILFASHHLSMFDSSLYQTASAVVTITKWCVTCLCLGASAAGIAYVVRHLPDTAG